MNIPALVFLILFGVASLANLFFCYLENEKWRYITKPLCLLFLAIAAILFAPKQPLIYVGAFCGLIGDIFLLKKKNKVLFTIGGVSFLAGHIIYVIEAISLLSYKIPWFYYLIVVGVLVALSISLIPLYKKFLGKFTPFAIFYLTLLLLNAAMGLMLIIDNPSKPLTGILYMVGYLLFFVSDNIIVYTLFIRDIKRRDFYIMLSYLTAELLIVFGLLVPFIS